MRWRANRLLFILSILAVGGEVIRCDVPTLAQEQPVTPKAESPDKPDEATPAASDQSPPRERPARGPGRTSEAPDSRLERIEKQLLEITKSLQGMQKESEKPTPPTKVDQPAAESPAKATPAEDKKEWDGVLSKEWLKGVRWRNVGPANMGATGLCSVLSK